MKKKSLLSVLAVVLAVAMVGSFAWAVSSEDAVSNVLSADVSTYEE